MIKARVNTIHTGKGCAETEPIDGPISFPSVNSNRVIVQYYNALVLTLCINGFDVHKVLVDPGSVAVTTTDLQADKAFLRDVELSRVNPLWLQRDNYHNIMGCRTPCNSRTSHSTNSVLNCQIFAALQCHSKADLAALDESYPLNLPSNDQLFD